MNGRAVRIFYFETQVQCIVVNFAPASHYKLRAVTLSLPKEGLFSFAFALLSA
jgi:hypothetical protein